MVQDQERAPIERGLGEDLEERAQAGQREDVHAEEREEEVLQPRVEGRLCGHRRIAERQRLRQDDLLRLVVLEPLRDREPDE